MKILGISGSLRKGSYNTALLRAAVGLMPQGAELEAATLHEIPLYDGDAEAAQGIPAAVQLPPRRVQERDRLTIAPLLRRRQGVRRPA
ncbi:MAG TPA: NAD(P)H-dependent oxidoreductase, partial [Burkholderiales bacterium]|nr:NAD(P)H-dependent oxidoreductase [Burkholderiales bacterium]